jgi:hypothetical protein
MTGWYLLFGAHPNLVQIEGPFTTRAECVRREYFSTSWCLAGCVQARQIADAIDDLKYEPPTFNTGGTYCSDHQRGE